MAIKKSELYSKLWKSCDELRGGMDASQYKDYVLTLLFVKYISDKFLPVYFLGLSKESVNFLKIRSESVSKPEQTMCFFSFQHFNHKFFQIR